MAASNSRDNNLRAAFDAGVIVGSTYERLTSFFAAGDAFAAALGRSLPKTLQSWRPVHARNQRPQ
jgi:hypothetical protein